MTDAIPAPYVDRLTVKDEWLDPNGHMNVAFYLRAVDDGSNAFFDDVGLGWHYTREGVGSIFVMSCDMDFKEELFVGAPLCVTTQLLDWNPKLIHCYAEVRHAEEHFLAAVCETLYMHISFATRRGAHIPASSQERLAKVLAAHRAKLPAPSLSRPLGIRR